MSGGSAGVGAGIGLTGVLEVGPGTVLEADLRRRIETALSSLAKA